jgi:hypothetical protein
MSLLLRPIFNIKQNLGEKEVMAEILDGAQ